MIKFTKYVLLNLKYEKFFLYFLRMKIDRYDPYKLGYTCATIFYTKSCNYENKSKSLK